MGVMHGSDVEDSAQRLLHGAKDLALETVVPASIDRVRDLAERLQSGRYREQVRKLERDFAHRTQKLERHLEQRVKRLPVDTPLDRRRRRRARRRGATGAVVIVALGGAAAFVAWRVRRAQASPAEQPPERRDDVAASPGAPARDWVSSNEHASASRAARLDRGEHRPV